MSSEVFVRKTRLAPLEPCSTNLARRLNRKDPVYWRLVFPVSTVISLLILPVWFTGFFVVMAAVVRQPGFLIPAAVFFLIVFAVGWVKRRTLSTPCFDFDARCFYRSWSRPRSGEFESAAEYHPFSELEEIQIIGKMVHRSKGGPVACYELALRLKDGERVLLCGSGEFRPLERDAKELASALHLPLAVDVSQVIPPKPPPMWMVVTFPLITLLAGIIPLVIDVLVPLQKNAQAAHWQEVPAQVVSSRLLSEKRRNRRSTYTVYKAEVVYTYKFKGKVYSADRHDMFSDGYSSNYGRQSRSVKENPPGRQRSCFVDPKSPAEAVLSREIPRNELIFEGVGFGLLASAGAVFFCYLLHLRRRRMR